MQAIHYLRSLAKTCGELSRTLSGQVYLAHRRSDVTNETLLSRSMQRTQRHFHAEAQRRKEFP